MSEGRIEAVDTMMEFRTSKCHECARLLQLSSLFMHLKLLKVRKKMGENIEMGMLMPMAKYLFAPSF